MRRIIVLLFVVLLVLPVGLARATEDESREATLTIVTTTTQATDAVRAVGGPLVTVVSLVGPGVDPHVYIPTESDIRAMNAADAVFYNGLGLEAQFEPVFATLAQGDVVIYPITTPLSQQGYVMNVYGIGGGEAGVPDPHVWNHPYAWILVVQGIADQLSALDPAHADRYQASAAESIAEIEATYAWATEMLAQVPPEQRVLVTSHDAFQYFAAAYGWQVVGIQGVSTEAEAGVADIQATVDAVVRHDLPAIFVESSVSPETVNAVIEGAAARGQDVRTGVRSLYADAMDAPDHFAGTYVGMTITNITTILQSYDVPILHWPAGFETAASALLREG